METNIKPASKAQLWALYCAYKADYRDKNLSYDDADKLLKEANLNRKHTPKKEKFKDYILSDENVLFMYEKLKSQFNIKSIIENDITPGKKYTFLGFGCGFSYLRYDGRSKKAKSIENESRLLKSQMDRLVKSKFTKAEIKALDDCGNPLEAHQMQNMEYNSAYNSLVCKYLQNLGIDCWVDSRLD